ncbi:MAG TPA: 50S ribosomal protein L29 [Gammaproteobacteria bacterium]|jgi:large subunit ribosomal protein L29|nr:50S ribosomal protein L29 [Gammaproteobacteria bacterium]
MKANELRNKSSDELNRELSALLKEQFNIRLTKAANRTAEKSHLIKVARRNIARIKTILREKGQNQ